MKSAKTTLKYYFHCKTCRIPKDSPQKSHQSFDEIHNPVMLCPVCDMPMAVITKRHYANILNAQKSTGPRTAEGKERSTANNFKTGEHAKIVRPLAPAIYGRYPECIDCERGGQCKDKELKWCPTCLKQLAKFVEAYKGKNVESLSELAGYTQAQMWQALQMGMRHIFENGAVVLDTKFLKSFMDGKIKKEIIEERFRSHPFLQDALTIIEKLGFSADQQAMTPAKQENIGDMSGFLKDAGEAQKGVVEFGRTMTELVGTMQKQILADAAKMREKDEALAQYQREKSTEIGKN